MTEQELYTKWQKESGIEVGDTVKVLRKAKDGELGWGGWWTKSMNSLINKECKVFHICPNNGFHLIHTSNAGVNHRFPYFVLKVVKKAKPKAISLELNTKYSATVTKDSITVGCQKFDISILDRLQEAREKLL